MTRATFEGTMKIRYKLPLALGGALLMAIAAGLFGIYQLNRTVDTYAQVIAQDFTSERAAAQILVDFKT